MIIMPFYLSLQQCDFSDSLRSVVGQVLDCLILFRNSRRLLVH